MGERSRFDGHPRWLHGGAKLHDVPGEIATPDLRDNPRAPEIADGDERPPMREMTPIRFRRRGNRQSSLRRGRQRTRRASLELGGELDSVPQRRMRVIQGMDNEGSVVEM
jgi:hypothetical protein